MKRAALLTSGILVIGLVLFSLSAFTAGQKSLFDRQASQIARAHRVQALFDSTATSITKLFNATPGFEIETGSDYIAFTEELPHETAFASELNELQTFIEAADDSVTIDEDAFSPLALQLLPHNIQYVQSSENVIEVLADELPGTKYVVTITLNRPIVSCDYLEDEGAFELEIVAEGTENTDCSSVRLVDPDGDASFTINTNADPVAIALSNADLTVEGTGITVRTELWYGTTEERREVRLGEESAVRVEVPRLELVRTGNPLITTW